jgi:hypothetical protein
MVGGPEADVPFGRSHHARWLRVRRCKLFSYSKVWRLTEGPASKTAGRAAKGYKRYRAQRRAESIEGTPGETERDAEMARDLASAVQRSAGSSAAVIEAPRRLLARLQPWPSPRPGCASASGFSGTEKATPSSPDLSRIK